MILTKCTCKFAHHSVEAARRLVRWCSLYSPTNTIGLLHRAGTMENMLTYSIGPTPDDITYSSLAKAFGGEPLEYHDETLKRMATGIRKFYGTINETEHVMLARKRMALFPRGAEVLFPTEEYWVPVVRVNGNVCVLPGIPSIFEGLLNALPPYLRLDPEMPKPIRRLIHTNLPESVISPVCVKAI